MNLSKEFTCWWINLLSKCGLKREEVFGDKKNEWDMRSDLVYIPVQWVYEAFKAHDEELDRLRKFEKKVRKLQDKCNKYSAKSADYWTSNRNKSVEYEMKYEEALEEFLYLQNCRSKVMKQLTKQKIQFYESAFNRGQSVMMFGRANHDLNWYTWIPIRDKKDIKKCVLNNIELRVDR